jgi:hypothetical protein
MKVPMYEWRLKLGRKRTQMHNSYLTHLRNIFRRRILNKAIMKTYYGALIMITEGKGRKHERPCGNHTVYLLL